ncbi:MAG: hypothetical protein IJ594_07955 [Oscillospiraceae bacterium]|nr:hypothetical protein [Oscillospiraceae bacterium]
MKNRIRIIIVLILSVVFLSACGNNTSDAMSPVYANQDDFLSAMAKGIQNRLAQVDDAAHANDTDEQEAAYYKNLVSCELDQISKYEEAVFEDNAFNELAHYYISACRMQQSACENMRNLSLYNSLWNGGRTIREGIITTLYQQYNLPISSEIAANYSAGSTVTITTSTAPNTPSATPAPNIDPSQFEVTEYSCIKYGTTYYYLVVKNNSEYTVKIDSSAIAKDSSGNVVGASDLDGIDALGPGEETIGVFYFSNVVGVDHLDYQLNYSAQDRYSPVIGNLSAQVHVNDKNVIVQATNNGDYPARFVHAYVLFFDENGNVVDEEDTYLTDSASEIKPGATQSGQLNTREAFDHIGVFFQGRG